MLRDLTILGLGALLAMAILAARGQDQTQDHHRSPSRNQAAVQLTKPEPPKPVHYDRLTFSEDVEEATIAFLHLAEEDDTLGDDLAMTVGRGVVLGIEDGRYAILTTRCAVDFGFPNHSIRTEALMGRSEKETAPAYFNEGIVVRGGAADGTDEWFAMGTTNIFPQQTKLPTSAWFEAPPTGGAGASYLTTVPPVDFAPVLQAARAHGDIATVDPFVGRQGEASDVAILFLPTRATSTARLRHLGMVRPKETVQAMLTGQAKLLGFDLTFNCTACQIMVRGYQSQEEASLVKGLILGFAMGAVTAAAVSALFPGMRALDLASSGASEVLPLLTSPQEARFADSGTRKRVLERDGFRCIYSLAGMCTPSDCKACLARNFHIDHVAPFSRGGVTALENLVTACATCNLSKGARGFAEWLAQRQGRLAAP